MTEQIVYLGNIYDAEEFERQFNPRLMVEDDGGIYERRNTLSEAARAALPHELGVHYGPGEREIVDIFPAKGGDAPVLIYLHGGYFRMGHARENNYAVRTFAEAGAAAFVATYDLCPDVPLTTIVDQAKRAIAWVYDHAAGYGGDPNSLYICGHSAGAHLAAMCLADGVPGVPDAAILGVSLISGIYDLEPVSNISINDDLRLEEMDLFPLSPLNNPPTMRIPVVIAWGTAESAEWQRQSKLYGSVARSGGALVEELAVEGADHYSIAFDLTEPEKPLPRIILSMMGLG